MYTLVFDYYTPAFVILVDMDVWLTFDIPQAVGDRDSYIDLPLNKALWYNLKQIIDRLNEES